MPGGLDILNRVVAKPLPGTCSSATSGVPEELDILNRVVAKPLPGKCSSATSEVPGGLDILNRVVRGCHPALDKEAIRVVKAMPKWIPGSNNGQPVNVTYKLTITFRLQK